MTLVDEVHELIDRLAKRRVELHAVREAGDKIVADLRAAERSVDVSSSRSWLGYQSTLYFGEFERAPAYSIEWGGHPEGWRERTYEEVLTTIESRSSQRLQLMLDTTHSFRDSVDDLRREMSVVLAPLADHGGFDEEQSQAKRIAETKWGPSMAQILQDWLPGDTMSRDTNAIGVGFLAPAHRRIAAAIEEAARCLVQGEELLVSAETLARRVTARLEHKPDKATDEVRPTGEHVFIVHGHDEASKQTVARYLEHLDIQPVILQDEANAGMTLVEKLVHHGGRAGFCVVILSPDDIGALAVNEPIYEPRARQNVVFEMGYFIGALGRQYVAVLLAGGVKSPSDIDGVGYLKMTEDWKLQLAKELKVAGFDIDLNKAI